MKWVTREKARVDRIACPWLITRFIDKNPTFLFVPANQVMAVAEREGAIPYDVPGWSSDTSATIVPSMRSWGNTSSRIRRSACWPSSCAARTPTRVS